MAPESSTLVAGTKVSVTFALNSTIIHFEKVQTSHCLHVSTLA